MKSLLLPHSRSLIDEIVSRLESSNRDFSDYLIVFPGKRPSHFLRKALAEREKTSLIPPLLFSIDEFIDYLYEKESKSIKRKLEAIDGAAILYDLHKKNPDPLGGDNFLVPDSFLPIGLKLFNAIEELYIEGIESEKVANIEHISNEPVPAKSAGRLQSVSYFYNEFYKIVENEGRSTRSYRYKAVSEKIDAVDLSEFKKIIIAGFFALTNSERVLFKKILDQDNSFFIFQDGTGIQEKLKELFNEKEIPIIRNSEKKSNPEFYFYQSPDTHGQVFGLNGVIKNKIKKKLSLKESDLIVLPSPETLFPLLHQTLSMFNRDSYNISMGYPLRRTPIFGFYNSLMNLITSMEDDRFYIPDYLKFVLHPYTKNIYFEGRADITRIVFHAIETKLSEKKNRAFITLKELEEKISAFDDFNGEFADLNSNIFKEHLCSIHEKIICKFISFKNVNDFALKGIEILSYIWDNSSARLHPFFYPFSEEFIKSLDKVANSLFKDISFSETSGYFNFFRKYITMCRTPFEGTPVKGLQVLGFLETRNLKFDRIFILDANEGTLPNIDKEDSFLPYKARKILNLPTYREKEKLAAYYFDNLTKGVQEAHIFFIEKNKNEKSRFVEKLIWEQQKKDKKTDTKDYIKSIQYNVKLHTEGPEPIKKSPEVIKFLKACSYSATSVDTYLACPLKFYYRYVLKLGKRKYATGDIEKSEIGEFVHKLLFKYFENKKGRFLKITDINFNEMENLLDKLFKEDYGDEILGQAYLLNIQAKRRMKEFLEKYQIPILEKNEIEIIELESKFNTMLGSFNLKGKIDRIEKRNGKIVIIDYKTSSNIKSLSINYKKLNLEDRNSWNEAIGSIQLPFYLTLFSNKTAQEANKINPLFLALSSLTIDETIEKPLFKSTEEAAEYFPLLQDIIFKLLNEIINPNIPLAPALDFKKSCSYCDFQTICGV